MTTISVFFFFFFFSFFFKGVQKKYFQAQQGQRKKRSNDFAGLWHKYMFTLCKTQRKYLQYGKELGETPRLSNCPEGDFSGKFQYFTE